ncbi:MAG: hypothetical protein ACO1RX_14465 [Candidatus Sericytochromatia bacterium]
MYFKKFLGIFMAFSLTACSSAAPGVVNSSANKPDESKVTATAPLFTQKVNVNLKAAVIKGSGDIVPVARTEFMLYPYSTTKIREEIEAKNNPGPEPSMSDKKYKNRDCTMIGSSEFCYTNYEQYEADSKAWKEKAHAGLDEAIAEAKEKAGTSAITVQTDLEGEATIEIPVGKWYVSGRYSLLGGDSRIYWSDVEFNIDSKTQKIELSNDNGEIFNS